MDSFKRIFDMWIYQRLCGVWIAFAKNLFTTLRCAFLRQINVIIIQKVELATSVSYQHIHNRHKITNWNRLRSAKVDYILGRFRLQYPLLSAWTSQGCGFFTRPMKGQIRCYAIAHRRIHTNTAHVVLRHTSSNFSNLLAMEYTQFAVFVTFLKVQSTWKQKPNTCSINIGYEMNSEQ